MLIFHNVNNGVLKLHVAHIVFSHKMTSCTYVFAKPLKTVRKQKCKNYARPYGIHRQIVRNVSAIVIGSMPLNREGARPRLHKARLPCHGAWNAQWHPYLIVIRIWRVKKTASLPRIQLKSDLLRKDEWRHATEL